jgi:hypothetical protein
VIEDEKGTASPSLGGANTKDGRTQTGRDDLTNGIVLLEENGTDRLVVGDAIQPQILGSVGKRSGTEHSSQASGSTIRTAMSAADTSRQVTMHC